MGARGKKRRRADGTIATSGIDKLVAPTVPPVKEELVAFALEKLRNANANLLTGLEGEEPGQAELDVAYRGAQIVVRAAYGVSVGDAALWRAFFLDKMLELEAPTSDQLSVAASIPTNGAERQFNMVLFDQMLEARSN